MAPSGPGRAVIGFYGVEDAHIWDTSSSALGPTVTGAPDIFASDGKGALIGPRTTYLADGGSVLELVRVPLADGGADAAVVVPNPFSDPTGFPGGVEVWPTP
jgi:hypothetical protein